MKLKNFTVRAALATAACFLISYCSAGLANLPRENGHVNSLFKAYSQNKDVAQLTEVTKNIPVDDTIELDIRLVKSDVKFVKALNQDIVLNLKGFYDSKGAEVIQTSQEGGRLVVALDHGQSEQAFFHMDFQLDEELTVGLPAQIKKVIVKTVSGDVVYAGIILDELLIGTVSGDVRLKAEALKNLTVKTVSGSVQLEGPIQDINLQTVSSDVHFLAAANQVFKADMKSTSGDIKLFFDKKPDLSVDFMSISGDLNVAHSFDKIANESRTISFKWGQGLSHLEARTTSGDVSIEPASEFSDDEQAKE